MEQKPAKPAPAVAPIVAAGQPIQYLPQYSGRPWQAALVTMPEARGMVTLCTFPPEFGGTEFHSGVPFGDAPGHWRLVPEPKAPAAAEPAKAAA